MSLTKGCSIKSSNQAILSDSEQPFKLAMADKKLNIGIVGYGFSARVFQIPFIHESPRFQLRAIVHRGGDGAANDHPECTIYKTAIDMFNDDSIDVVVLSTPPATHYELALEALDAGKHGKNGSFPIQCP